jgi:hypothetical protein
MLARSVIRVPLAGRPAWLPTGFAVLDQPGHQLLVLDPKLAIVARIPAPISDDRFNGTVSTDGSLAAFASLDRTVVTDADGNIRWQQEFAIKRQGLPQMPAVHIDRAGRLWLYVPDGDHIAVFDARTGDEIDRTGLSSCIGAGEFVAHPGGVHVGLCVSQGQDGTNSYWLDLDEGRIVQRELPGETLAGITRSGHHYLDLPHVDTRIAIRRFVDDAIVASCVADEIPGFELHDRSGFDNDEPDPDADASWRARPGYQPNDGAGAFLNDDYVLVGVFTDAYDEDETELHLILSRRSLRWVSTVDYGQHGPPAANSIVRGHHDHWLTYDWRAGVATLWEQERATREIAPELFDLP